MSKNEEREHREAASWPHHVLAEGLPHPSLRMFPCPLCELQLRRSLLLIGASRHYIEFPAQCQSCGLQFAMSRQSESKLVA